MIKKNKEIIPLPFPVYFWTVVFLAATGLFVSVYLAVNHYRNYADIGYSSFCAISKAINCDTVAQSTYSVLLGVPVAVWGIIGYGFFLLGLCFAGLKKADQQRMWTLLFFLSLLFSLISIYYAIISTFYIYSYCIVCLLSYAVNLLLLYFIWIVRKRFNPAATMAGLQQDVRFLWINKKPAAAVLGPFLICVVLVFAFFPAYWKYEMPALTSMLDMGVTEDGHPWIGSRNPKIVITEYTDYMCFQCKKMHAYLRLLTARYPDKIKLIHRNFPMDSRYNPIVKIPFHEGSGELALLAAYALTENKFWKMNDILFGLTGQEHHIALKGLADRSGVTLNGLSGAIFDQKLVAQLQRDIIDGIKLGIDGTPTYVIDGELHIGQISPEIIKAALE